MPKTLTLTLITQERKLLEEEAVSVTLPGEEGELTVLPDHASLFIRIKPGTITVKTPTNQQDQLVTTGGGFAEISAKTVKVMAETATHAAEIDEAKAEIARQAAEEAMQNRDDRQKFIEAELSLRKALLEIETARKWKKMKSLS